MGRRTGAHRRELPSNHPSSRDGWVRGGVQRVTGEVRHLQQQVIQFVHEDGDEDCVEVRRGTPGTQ